MILVITIDSEDNKTFSTYRAAVDAAMKIARVTDNVTIVIAAVQDETHTRFSPVFYLRGDEDRGLYERLINSGFKVIQ